ncbi:Lipase [Neolecta irregularis DAH-3]|uniref:Lipase n=1 Tax=Neolecta irregularis (strain DAH-3) TaxID=1198029 RepID=A0A1U7LMN9_NEOID|nr:Lipase [Neolecta irregularis DAH-3]|eukprot:OLL23924.1 Lipase [Neolecta irregularis DAH-3]
MRILLYLSFLGDIALASEILFVPINSKVKQVTLEQYFLFKQLSKFQAIAYCAPYITPKFQCASYCSDYKNVSLVKTFQTDLNTDIAGYLARDDNDKRLLLVFRGSYSVVDVIDDLRLASQPYAVFGCSNCAIHDGFYAGFLAVKDLINDILLESIHQFPHYDVWVLGHSLGAAVAGLYAVDLKSEAGIQIKVVTFGGPRIGNQAFAKFMNDLFLNDYLRITHLHDQVPRLPPSLLGYSHQSSEYYQSTWKWNREDMIICNESEDKCKPEYPGLISDMLTAHLYYFMSFGHCLLPIQ